MDTPFLNRLSRKDLVLPAVAMIVLLVPWLGEMMFASKGEPREALVAVSMLDSGNWVLPECFGQDIPYKPPFLAWLISIGSLLLCGGHVSEFTARLPSAVAAIALLCATWRIVARRAGKDCAWLSIILLGTAFEFYRAAMACRVDMVLTACMVGALYAMFTMKGHPWRCVWAILLMTGATLTKGPVGTLLPCAAMGIYMMIRKENVIKTVFRLSAMALVSFILPALWYYMAWRQGGDGFVSLAWEENIGRLTGNMGYESHLNPWYYNLITIVAGMLPWTLPLVICLCLRKVRRRIVRWWHTPKSALSLFSWTVFLTVFIFYCIPASKRSVYLLPCYPFMAIGAAWVLSIVQYGKAMRVWAKFMAWLAVLAPVALVSMHWFATQGFQVCLPPWYLWPLAVLPVLTGAWWLLTRSSRADGVKGACVLTYTLMLAYGAVFAPAVMNPRSDSHLVGIIKHTTGSAAVLYMDIKADSLLRYYTLGYYMDNRLRMYNPSTVRPGNWVLTDELDYARCTQYTTLSSRSCDTGKPVYLYRVVP